MPAKRSHTTTTLTIPKILPHPADGSRALVLTGSDSAAIRTVRNTPGALLGLLSPQDRRFRWSVPASEVAGLVSRLGRVEVDPLFGVEAEPDASVTPTHVLADFHPQCPTYAALVAPEKAMGPEDHQATGSSWLIQHPIGIQGDDMGTGKSKMAIDAVRYVHEREACNRVLIVAKAGNVGTWVHEIAKFDPFATIFIANSTPAQRVRVYADLASHPKEQLAYLVVGYEVMRTAVDYLAAMRWDWIVCDEAHKLKSTPLNAQAQVAQAIHRLHAPRMHAMTGTLLVNAPEDAWNVLTWLGIESRTWDQFESDTCVAITYNISDWTTRRKIVQYRPEGLRQLRQLILPNLIRRKKGDVTTLPPVVPTVREVTLNTEEQHYYTEAEAHLRLSLQLPDKGALDFTTIPNDNVLKLRLKQITSSIEPFIGKPYRSVKLQEAVELVEEAVAQGQKVIVFSQFLAVVNALHRELIRFAPVVVTGSSLHKDEAVNRFQTDPACHLFIGSTSACREGLTLTAGSVMIFIDEEWSPEYIKQSIGRANRIGQTRSLTVYFLRAVQRNGRGTIDQAIGDRVEAKALTMAKVLQ
jgi:SNF2 family DNA or RNA helicase